ncbi:MAG: TIGR03986 family CRISPR-associated RAMP protein [Magnetococcales bacterium]|nr:TIGR03986 family CRISPR-associated RAMP protein [Magnetococcales bacterium]
MSDEILEGILKLVSVKKGLQLRLDYTTCNGKPQQPVVEIFFKDQDVVRFDGKKAAIGIVDGQIQRLRVEGEEIWRERSSASTLKSSRTYPLGRTSPSPSLPRAPNYDESSRFYNPYNFVPALPRKSIPDGNGLEDAEPKGHDRYHPDHWSGCIRVRMTTITPLLLPDAARMVETENNPQGNGLAINIPKKGHKTYPVRVDDHGMPLVTSTGVKGMLRAAYEAITNSRLGVFAGHEERLALRMSPQDGSKVVPARIVRSSSGGLCVMLLPGDSPMNHNGSPNGHPPLAYAAWLARYNKNEPLPGQPVRQDKGESVKALCYPAPGNGLPAHRDAVAVMLAPTITTHSSGRFRFLSVQKIRKIVPGGALAVGERKGWVCVTGANIKNKHEERVFLEPATPITPVPLPPQVERGWSTLIKNYQQTHQKELADRAATPSQRPSSYLGNEPGRTAWSRHVYTDQDLALDDGALCYASVRKAGAAWEILALYPVMISRDLYNLSPSDMLDDSLHPATEMSQLSPADRVFGWVRQKGAGAFKGQIRVGPIICDAEDPKAAIQNFEDHGFPLAILGQPRPEQVRFYGSSDKQGRPFTDGSKKNGYATETQGLRGRKVYLHQPLLNTAYWKNAANRGNPSPSTHCRRAGDIRDNQNRSLTGWVKENVSFHFDLHVSNLSQVELGALLWLLNLPDKHYHRLGSGKPLGFGSVRLEVDTIDLANGQWWKAYYTSLEPMRDDIDSVDGAAKHLTDAHAEELGNMIQAFRTAVKAAFGNSFDNVCFIKAFCHAARGFTDFRTHYPHTDGQERNQDEGFQWFVANEKGEKHCLPSLIENHVSALPRNP